MYKPLLLTYFIVFFLFLFSCLSNGDTCCQVISNISYNKGFEELEKSKRKTQLKSTTFFTPEYIRLEIMDRHKVSTHQALNLLFTKIPFAEYPKTIGLNAGLTF